MDNASDTIKLSFPLNAAYVSSARLTASSIANRMGFDIDEIEDIKTAVSEACAFIIKSLAPGSAGNLEISFSFYDSKMKISMGISGIKIEQLQPDEISLMMIKALVDDFDLTYGKDAESMMIIMLKNHKTPLF